MNGGGSEGVALDPAAAGARGGLKPRGPKIVVLDGDGEEALESRVHVDEDLVMEVTRTLNPRNNRDVLIAQTGLLALVSACLIGIAVGGLVKLTELNESLVQLKYIQQGISDMTADIDSMANSVSALEVMKDSLGNLTQSMDGISQDIGQLSDIGGQLGSALGEGAGAALTSVASGVVNVAADALGGLLGVDRGRAPAAGDLPPGVDPAIALGGATFDENTPFGGCDPQALNSTALADCLRDPQSFEAAIQTVPPPQSRDGFDWQGLVGGILGAVGGAVAPLVENVGSRGSQP